MCFHGTPVDSVSGILDCGQLMIRGEGVCTCERVYRRRNEKEKELVSVIGDFLRFIRNIAIYKKKECREKDVTFPQKLDVIIL